MAAAARIRANPIRNGMKSFAPDRAEAFTLRQVDRCMKVAKSKEMQAHDSDTKSSSHSGDDTDAPPKDSAALPEGMARCRRNQLPSHAWAGMNSRGDCPTKGPEGPLSSMERFPHAANSWSSSTRAGGGARCGSHADVWKTRLQFCSVPGPVHSVVIDACALHGRVVDLSCETEVAPRPVGHWGKGSK